jgi:hypothetical protein
LNDLYSSRCDCCGGELHDLADDTEEWDNIYTDIAKQLLEGGDLDTDAIYNKTATQLIAAMNNGLGGTSFDDNDSRIALQKAFTLNLEAFSYAKTLTQFELFKDAVFNDKGQIQSFATVKKAVADTGEVFNNNYLRAEHQFVTQSAIMAHKWKTLDAEYLEFTTVGDSQVRPEHELFDKFTALKSDSIWRRLYTPLDWGCRCTVIPGISKNVSKEYDSDWANKTVTPLVEGTIFDNNAAITGMLFNKEHPYFKVDKKKSKGIDQPIIKELKTTKDVSDYFSVFAKNNPEYFERGFKEIKLTSQKNVNGFTDMNGSISLKKNILDPIKEALNSIQHGKKTTFEQERALSTMHHEMWHNANKPGNIVRLSKDGTKIMELANEFVSRNTLKDFMNKLGGNLEHSELSTNRSNTGYNGMVRKYDQLISFVKADKLQVLEDVKKGLIEKRYDEQLDVLAKAIKKHSAYDIEDRHAKGFVLASINDKMLESKYQELLEYNKNLFKPKSK